MPTVSVDIRRKLSALAVVTAMAATVFTAATPSATAAPSPGNPASDPFYAQPSPFPEVAPGTVLDSRPVTIRALTLPAPVRAWQVKYRSTDTDGAAIADVATIMQPVNPPAAGARKLVSYQTAQDGLTTHCAPSYVLTTGTALPVEELALMLPLVAAGYTVVTADYEGPDSEWAAAANTAHGVLDGIRAAQSFPPAEHADGPDRLLGRRARQ